MDGPGPPSHQAALLTNQMKLDWYEGFKDSQNVSPHP